jgi:hypothetical protein
MELKKSDLVELLYEPPLDFSLLNNGYFGARRMEPL